MPGENRIPAQIRGGTIDTMRAGLLTLGSNLLAAPSLHLTAKMAFAAVVPDYSGGTVMDLHHLPYLSPTRETRTRYIQLSIHAGDLMSPVEAQSAPCKFQLQDNSFRSAPMRRAFMDLINQKRKRAGLSPHSPAPVQSAGKSQDEHRSNSPYQMPVPTH
jgi:hypothetical protein